MHGVRPAHEPAGELDGVARGLRRVDAAGAEGLRGTMVGDPGPLVDERPAADGEHRPAGNPDAPEGERAEAKRPVEIDHVPDPPADPRLEGVWRRIAADHNPGPEPVPAIVRQSVAMPGTSAAVG